MRDILLGLLYLRLHALSLVDEEIYEVCALILEKDQSSAAYAEQILDALGYVAAATRTPFEALNVASSIDFEFILTYTWVLPNERRTLAGELKRYAPEALCT